MTTALTTDAQPNTTPLRLTSAELAFIGAAADTPQSVLCMTKLGLDDQANDATLQAVGASELMARELARINGDRVELIAGAGLTAAVLSGMQAWAQFGFSAADVANALIILRADEVALLIDPRPVGVFDFRLLRPGTSIDKITRPLVERFLDEGPDRLVVGRSGAGEAERSAAVLRGPAGEWQIAYEVPEPSTNQELQRTDFVDADHASALEALISATSLVQLKGSSEG